METATETVETRIPARMDRLPWSRWHWLVVAALGITWILDGLEVTIVSAVAAVLTKPETLGLTDFQVGFAGSMYLAGAITGALLFAISPTASGARSSSWPRSGSTSSAPC